MVSVDPATHRGLAGVVVDTTSILVWADSHRSGTDAGDAELTAPSAGPHGHRPAGGRGAGRPCQQLLSR
jgi:hypothetical protein